MPDKKEFIRFMIGAGVLRFGDFITKSGRNTPYFINTGNYSCGSELSALGGAYAEMITETTGSEYDAIFGPAYKGIPLAAAISVALAEKYGCDKRFFFNRKETKDHGEGGCLIGYSPSEGDRVIIAEDVITAGTALRESMALLKDYRLEIKDMFISVDRCEKGYNGKTAVEEAREEFGISVHSIVTIKDIIEFIENEDSPYKKYKAKMLEYMEKYCIEPDSRPGAF